MPCLMSLTAKRASTGASGSWFFVCTATRTRLTSFTFLAHRMYLGHAATRERRTRQVCVRMYKQTHKGA